MILKERYVFCINFEKLQGVRQMKSKNALFVLVLFLPLLLAGIVSAQLAVLPDGRTAPVIGSIPPSNPLADLGELERAEAEKRKAAAIEERTKEMKRAREAWETEMAERRRERAFDQAKKERRAYVRRIRGK